MEIRLSVKLDDGSTIDITRIGKKPNVVTVVDGKVAEAISLVVEDFVSEIARYCEGYKEEDMVEDGFGCSCSAYCPECGKKSMYVCRPGDIRCSNCDR